MERGATSAASIMLVVITNIIFMFLTRDVVMGVSHSCTGGEISDDGTHSAYVAHVLSELATVTPTTPKLQDITSFPPGDGASGTVAGGASCADPSDVSLCASCLSGLEQLLLGSCTTWSGGYAEEESVCAMGFGTTA